MSDTNNKSKKKKKTTKEVKKSQDVKKSKRNLEEEVEKVLEEIDSKTEEKEKNAKIEKVEKEEVSEGTDLDDEKKVTTEEKKEEKSKEKKNLDLTTRIRIDRARLNDTGTLDTSFLDSNKNVRKRDIIVEENLLTKPVEEKKSHKFLKGFCLLLMAILVGFLTYYISAFYIHAPKPKTKVKVETKEVEKVVIDENVVFLGDEITEDYDIDEYFEDHFVVNQGKKDAATKDILDKLEEKVYQYNPSKIFLLIGINDLGNDDISNDDIVDNIEEIIKDIQGGRPYAKIYVESILPINDSDDDKIDEDVIDGRTNRDIKEVNEKLQEIAKELDVMYIDLFSELVDDDDKLDLDYTTDGLHISEKGYREITKKLLNYIEEE